MASFFDCPRRVLAQRPKPEESSLQSARIYSIYIVYQTKSRFAQSGPASSIGRCDKMPGRCDKFPCTVIGK